VYKEKTFMKNLYFKNLFKIVKYFFDKKINNVKKIAISQHLPFSKFNYFGKKNHPNYSIYKERLLSLKTDNLWVEGNLICFLNLFEEYQEKKLNILELGSYQGASAFLFLNLLKNSKITCVDSFADPLNYELFEKNLKEFSIKERVTVSKSSTLYFFSKGMKKNFYDIIYIDAGHGYSDLTIDIHCSFDQVKDGGIIILDDYEWNEKNLMPMDKNVRLAINDFLERAHGCYEVLHHGYIVILKKIKDFNGFQLGENYYDQKNS
jgi:predicted O-methyltransferase YrrM